MLEELHQLLVFVMIGALLCNHNHVHLVVMADIQGVHIEDMDADLTLIRNEIGESKTLKDVRT
jgi:thiamine-phosphate pyrophosphorylase